MSLENPNFKAVGDIYPCRFVNIADDSGKNFSVEELVDSADVSKMVGISTENGREARHDVSDTRAAADGDVIMVHGLGAFCLLEMAATCNKGQLLKANTSTDGRGIPVSAATGSGQQVYGAQALVDNTVGAGVKIQVRVLYGIVPAGGLLV